MIQREELNQILSFVQVDGMQQLKNQITKQWKDYQMIFG